MNEQRQEAFQKLRPVCVELSSVALKFKGRQATVKDVLTALQIQSTILQDLGYRHQLDEKLAEYAFFPLTHIFNESQNLSPRCMQVAVESIVTLISKGWRQRLSPALGRQILILMVFLAGGDPGKQPSRPPDEIRCAAMKCIASVLEWLPQSSGGNDVLRDESGKRILDQLAYLLVEALTEAVSDDVQIAAAEALLELVTNNNDRIFLASLLPRTISALTKALRPTTQSRRTRKVLVTNLNLFKVMVLRVLADNLTLRENLSKSEQEALSQPWLKATTTQINTALTQVCRLRNHDQETVRTALFRFCTEIVQQCIMTLKDSIIILIETAVIVSANSDNEAAVSELELLMASHPYLAETLQLRFYDWCTSLPRTMLGNDNQPKERLLSKISSTLGLLTRVSQPSRDALRVPGAAVLRSLDNVIEGDTSRSKQLVGNDTGHHLALMERISEQHGDFSNVLFDHQSQKTVSQALHRVIFQLKEHPSVLELVRSTIDGIPDSSSNQRIGRLWLTVQLLRDDSQSLDKLDTYLNFADDPEDKSLSRPFLVQDLYIQSKQILLDSSAHDSNPSVDPRLTALVLESVVLQAQQLGTAYRTELYETLYPIIALLNSGNTLVQSHAIIALRRLAISCEYSSVSDLLMQNVDYLVNSIAWKINTFNLSPEAPIVLNMVVRLAGAQVIPYLDDIIASVFSALDNFHGYTDWVQMLFHVLRSIVDESVKMPQLAITKMQPSTYFSKHPLWTPAIEDIVRDLRGHKHRKIARRTKLNYRESAPQRPWTKPQDDPNYKADPTEGKDIETLLREAEIADEENDLPTPKEVEDEDFTKPLTRSHSLLLQIAEATVPHLSSPSANIRSTLLQLLIRVVPLLAQHENTFLPLINNIWPAVVSRLFADIASSTPESPDQDLEGEAAYNVAAAADLAASLCDHAGDFMSTRIDQIFDQLKAMYARISREAEGQLLRNDTRLDTAKMAKMAKSSGVSAIEDVAGENITGGAVDLQIVKSSQLVSHVVPSSAAAAAATATSTQTGNNLALSLSYRTGAGQIFSSLTRLLIAILDHTRLNTDHADDIFNILVVHMDRADTLGEKVLHALERFNPDAVWVAKSKSMGELGIARGIRRKENRALTSVSDLPVLNTALRQAGVRLRPVVF